jgi:2,4-dienoyl-CoA reductase-like NADH-dependent reductase (Old Yellow Enzyme family)
MNFWGSSLRDETDKKPRAVIIQERVGNHIPIMGVGAVHTPAEALQMLETGVPLVAIGRELLMEPDWVQKIQEGREDQIRTTLPTGAQKELVIPEGMWKVIMSMKGWLPVVD